MEKENEIRIFEDRQVRILLMQVLFREEPAGNPCGNRSC
jgi:hypothetical protein